MRAECFVILNFATVRRHSHCAWFASLGHCQSRWRPKRWESKCFVLLLRSRQIIARRAERDSDAELVSKLGIVLQELDESLLWLELLAESGIVAENRLSDLQKECDELIRMIVTAIKKLKDSLNQPS